MTLKEACLVPGLLQEASPSTKAKAMSYGVLKKYKKGEMIFRDKEEVNQIYFVITGYVSLYKINKQHDKKVIFIYGSGEALNEVILDDLAASINCETLSDTLVLSFYRHHFLEMMEQDYQFSKAVHNSMSLKIRRLYHQLCNTSNSMHLDKQIASKLWKLSRDFGIEENGEIEIGFDLSITYLADLVGSKRETVSRVVKQLADRKLIAVYKNRFIILDRVGLHNYCTG